MVRWKFSDDRAVLVREFGTERKAGGGCSAPGDDGPLATLGPEVTSNEFAEWLRTSDDGRRVHTILRDQHTVAGVGRGYADDALHRAQAFAVREREVAQRRRARAPARRDRRGARRRARARAHPRPAGSRRTSSVSTSPCTARPVSRARCATRPEAGVVRVARGRVLPALPDRRQGARRPPALPPRQVAGRGRPFRRAVARSPKPTRNVTSNDRR